MLQAYEGYLENGRFYPSEPVSIHGRQKVILTVIKEPTPKPDEPHQAKAWREFFEAVNTSDEEMPEAIERINFVREVEL